MSFLKMNFGSPSQSVFLLLFMEIKKQIFSIVMCQEFSKDMRKRESLGFIQTPFSLLSPENKKLT